MPEDEVAEDVGGEESTLMYGKRGWAIVFGVFFLQLAFFLAYIHLKGDTTPVTPKEGEEGLNRLTLADYMKVEVTLDKLTYSIPMPSGMPMTLAMDITLVMQPTPNELNNNIELTPQDWDTFKKAVEKMKPWIKDQLTRRINKMSSSELNTDRGQEQIREFLKEKINYELERISFTLSRENVNQKRITDVYITNYYFN